MRKKLTSRSSPVTLLALPKELVRLLSDCEKFSETSYKAREQAEILLAQSNIKQSTELLKLAMTEDYKILANYDEIETKYPGAQVDSKDKISALHCIAWCCQELGDEKQHRQILKKAADLNDPKAIYLYGRIHFKNDEYKPAASYFLKLNNKTGLFLFYETMGVHYESLDPIDFENSEKNYKNAEKVLSELSLEEKSSAIIKEREAFFYNNFGSLYFNKKPKNLTLAIHYFSRAANLNHKGAQFNLSLCLSQLDDSEAEKSALEWCEKAANQGLPQAQDTLARKLLFATPAMQDEKIKQKALNLFTQAAPNFPPAKCGMAGCLSQGIGVEKDVDQAIHLFKELIQGSNQEIASRAKNNLGVIYITEKNDLLTGAKYIQEAASENEPLSLGYLAYLHEFGIGTEVNSELAEKLLIQAAKKMESAKLSLMELYERRHACGIMDQKLFEEKYNDVKQSFSDKLCKTEQIISLNLDLPPPSNKKSKKENDPFFKKMNAIIVRISKNKSLYEYEKIRCIFANIQFADQLNNINLATALLNIGKLFSAFNDKPILIQKYLSGIEKLLKKLSEQSLDFTPGQIAMCLDGLSKLHLIPTQSQIEHPVILLLNYAKVNISLFSCQDLSMTVSAMIRMGLSYEMLGKYLPIFLGRIQNLWLKFKDLKTLVHLAFMFAVLDANQLSRGKRLVSFRLLGQLFNLLNTDISQLNETKGGLPVKYRSQLDLSLRHFTQHYPTHFRLAAAYELKKNYHGAENLKLKVTNSQFQDEVTLEVYDCVGKDNVQPEYVINGLPVDICLLKEKVAVPANGPSHFLHSFDQKTLPIETPIEVFHVGLIKSAKYRVSPVKYYEWGALFTKPKRAAYLKEIGVPVVTQPSSSSSFSLKSNK